VSWEAVSVVADDTRIGRELETGHQQPAVLVPDLIELAGSGAPLPALDGAWFAPGDRFLLAADPADERVACWHLWPASRFFDLPEAWQHAVARSAPQVVAKLLQRDGTLALRAAVGRSGVPGADARPSPMATALLALWRLQRHDRTGAWRSLAAVAARQTAANLTWLPWAWDGDGATARQAAVASAALFVLATLEALARPDGEAWRVGLPEQLDACELERLRLGDATATLRLRRAQTVLLAELMARDGSAVRLLDDAGMPVPHATPTRAPAGALPAGRAAPLRLPATLEHLVLGGPAYQRRFIETTALLRHLAASEVEILRVRRRLSASEEEKATAELLRLGSAVERNFELGLRR
jgi:hypothetical protein